MALAKCVFCGREQEDFQGTYLIKNDGTLNYYCSSKCRKNHIKLGRDKRRVRWTAAFHEVRAKHRAAEEKKKHASNEGANTEHKPLHSEQKNEKKKVE